MTKCEEVSTITWGKLTGTVHGIADDHWCRDAGIPTAEYGHILFPTDCSVRPRSAVIGSLARRIRDAMPRMRVSSPPSSARKLGCRTDETRAQTQTVVTAPTHPPTKTDER